MLLFKRTLIAVSISSLLACQPADDQVDSTQLDGILDTQLNALQKSEELEQSILNSHDKRMQELNSME